MSKDTKEKEPEEKQDRLFDFSKPLHTIKGEIAVVDNEPILLAEEIASILSANLQGESGRDKLRAYRLAMRMMDNKDAVELSPGDLVFITRRVVQVGASPLVIGQLVEVTGYEPED